MLQMTGQYQYRWIEATHRSHENANISYDGSVCVIVSNEQSTDWLSREPGQLLRENGWQLRLGQGAGIDIRGSGAVNASSQEREHGFQPGRIMSIVFQSAQQRSDFDDASMIKHDLFASEFHENAGDFMSTRQLLIADWRLETDCVVREMVHKEIVFVVQRICRMYNSGFATSISNNAMDIAMIIVSRSKGIGRVLEGVHSQRLQLR